MLGAYYKNIVLDAWFIVVFVWFSAEKGIYGDADRSLQLYNNIKYCYINSLTLIS